MHLECLGCISICTTGSYAKKPFECLLNAFFTADGPYSAPSPAVQSREHHKLSVSTIEKRPNIRCQINMLASHDRDALRDDEVAGVGVSSAGPMTVAFGRPVWGGEKGGEGEALGKEALA